MPNKILVERFQMKDMQYIAESRTDENGHHYLGRLEGPAADFTKPTRNGRKYPLQLWRNVENSDDFKEGMATLTIFGEADHPEERLETSIKEIAVVLRKMEIRENEGIVWCSFDILDTPNGRIVKELCDYGSRLGVSSRGSGEEIVDENNETVIDPDTYLFVAFDVVVMPAVVQARPKVVESVDLTKTKNLVESIKSEINSATTAQELRSIRSIVEAAKLPELDSIKESINNRLSLLGSGDDISAKLAADLGESATQLTELREKYESLKKKCSADNIRYRKLKEIYAESKKSASELRRCLTDARKQIAQLEDDLLESADQCSEFESQNGSLKSETSKLKKTVESLKRTNIALESRVRKLSSTETEVKESRERSSALSRSLKESRTQNQQLQKDLSVVQSELATALSESKSLRSKQRGLVSQVESLKTENASLSEERSRAISNYLKVKSVQCGISSDVIRNRLPEKFSISDIDRVVAEFMDRAARINRMPVRIPTASIVVNEHVDPDLLEEESQTMTILENMHKQNSI